MACTAYCSRSNLVATACSVQTLGIKIKKTSLDERVAVLLKVITRRRTVDDRGTIHAVFCQLY